MLLLALIGGTGYYGSQSGWWGTLRDLLGGSKTAPQPGPPTSPRPPATAGQQASEELAGAVAERRSNVWLTAEGRVTRLLPDDNEGARHQCWILRTAGGVTVKISHNLDIAPRVPLDVDMLIRARGEYIWNEQGGVLHWTHRDPDRRREGGWIELAGKRYE